MNTPNFFIRDNALANEVRKLTKEIPNDMELGNAIRNLITNAEKQLEENLKNIIDDSHNKGY
jgi:uncharacterized protein YigA (DUF484 family)